MTNPRFLRVCRRLGAALLLAGAAPLLPQAAPDADAVAKAVAARLRDAYAYKSWAASVVTTLTDLDRAGKPEKTTVVHRTVRIAGGRREEAIQSAVEIRDGKSVDVTAQYVRDARKRREKEEKRRAEEAKNPGAKPGRGRTRIEDILPFADSRRPWFTFAVRETADASGRKLLLLDVRAKVKDTRNWEGTFTIDPSTYDILRAEARPSKTPAFVKTLEAQAEIEVIGGRHFFVTRSRFKVEGGFLFIKRVRMIVEEAYSDVRILD